MQRFLTVVRVWETNNFLILGLWQSEFNNVHVENIQKFYTQKKNLKKKTHTHFDQRNFSREKVNFFYLVNVLFFGGKSGGCL